MKRPLTASKVISRPRPVLLAAGLGFALFAGSTCLAAPTGSALAPQRGTEASSECQLVKSAAAQAACRSAAAEYRKGNYLLSMNFARRALAASPKEGILRVQIARAMMRFTDMGPAQRELRHASQDGAPSQIVLPMLFNTMIALHQEIILLNEFPEPARNAKGEVSADILRGRAMAFFSMNRLTDAVAAMDRSLSIYRGAGGLLFRSKLATVQRNTALAKKLVDEAYRLAPEDAEVMVAKLGQLEQANDTNGVITLANRMQKLYPIVSDPWESKIRVYLKQNQDAKAKAELDAYSKLRPKAPLGTYYKAILMSRAHNRRGAAEAIQSIPPQFVKAHPEYAIQMAQLVIDNGHVESGASILGLALSTNPDRLDVRLRLAEIRMDQDSPQSALGILGPIKDSPDSRVQKLLARIRARIAKDRP